MAESSAALMRSAELSVAQQGPRIPLAERLAGRALASPALTLMWLMLLGPAVAVLVLSFTDWTFGAPEIGWSGLANYRELLRDKVFWVSLKNTLVYVAFVVPLSVAI